MHVGKAFRILTSIQRRVPYNVANSIPVRPSAWIYTYPVLCVSTLPFRPMYIDSTNSDQPAGDLPVSGSLRDSVEPLLMVRRRRRSQPRTQAFHPRFCPTAMENLGRKAREGFACNTVPPYTTPYRLFNCL